MKDTAMAKKKKLTKWEIITIAAGLAELHESNTAVLNEDPSLEPILRGYFYAGAALALGNVLEIPDLTRKASEKLLYDMETEVREFVAANHLARDQSLAPFN